MGVLVFERKPRLVVPNTLPRSRYVIVICTGLRKNGRTCSRTLGEINLNHPHDVQYTCRDCGSTYLLQKPIT